MVELDTLQARTALPVIEAAFKADAVDFGIVDWNSVQFNFGLITKEEFERQDVKNRAIRRTMMQEELGSFALPPAAPTPQRYKSSSTTSAAKKAKKVKRKMASASKKKNRKHK